MANDRDEKPTQTLDPRTVTGSWPITLATLERTVPWGRQAMKLGTIALLRHCTTKMLEDDAPGSLLDEADRLIKALRFMQWR